jgi:hypothetical protein
MIDYDLLIVAITSLLFFVVIGGTVLLFPLSRKLGHLLEARTRDARGVGLPDDAILRGILARLDALEDRVTDLTERQEFLDRLVTEKRPAGALEAGSSD